MKTFMIIFITFAISMITLESCEVVPSPSDDSNTKCEFTGTVHDYTGLDGCGFIIELDNGEKLEPAVIEDESFELEDGQRVSLSYEPIEAASFCMVGKVVKITCITDISCESMLIAEDNPSADYPDDPFTIKSAKVNGDCFEVTVGYSGGCEEHELKLVNFKPKTTQAEVSADLRLTHNSFGDMCEAYITRTVAFDLTPLRIPGQELVKFSFSPIHNYSNYYQIFEYKY